MSVYNSDLSAFTQYHLELEEQRPTLLNGPALPALGHAISGSTGAAISNVITYPLSLVITRLQVHAKEYGSIDKAAQKIYEEEGGVLGFFAGCPIDTTKTLADSFLFFLAYNFLRQRGTQNSSKLSVSKELALGMLAGAFSKLWTTPLSQIVTRLQANKKDESGHTPSISSIIQEIHSEKGITGFWSGYSATLVLTLNPSLTFLFFEFFKRALLRGESRQNPPAQFTFLMAAIGKSLASSITYPFSLAKSRAQASKTSEDDEKDIEKAVGKGSATKTSAARHTVFSTIARIVQTEGVGSLYQGLGGEVMKGFFSHGITMTLKDVIHTFIIQLYYAILKILKKYPSPEELAAAAKKQAGETNEAVQKTIQDAVQALNPYAERE